MVKDNLLDLPAIKMEIDGNEEIDVTSKKGIKHHLAMEHLGFSDVQIEEFVCDVGLTDISQVMDELRQRINKKIKLEK